MADVSSHAPGSFSWVELATTDAKAAVSFYRRLFGWDIVEHDMGPNGVYTIFTMRGRDVSAAAGQHPQGARDAHPAALEHVRERHRYRRGGQEGGEPRRQDRSAAVR